MSGPLQPRVSFGVFEVDRTAGELRKHGIRIKLHQKPFEILIAMLEHSGDVIPRKELQERLWPGHTFMEVENGLNNAISRLREDFGDTAESPRFIETIPRIGYRFLPQVSETIPCPAAASSFKTRPFLMALLVALGTGAAAVGFVSHVVVPRSVAIHSLAVLPFRNLGTSAADDSFAAGMTDAVTTDLTAVGVSKVASESSLEGFAHTNDTTAQIGRVLGVDGVVEGAVMRDGDEVRITVQLVRANTNHQIWADSYEGQMTNILGLQDQVAEDVARAIELQLSSSSARKLAPLANAKRQSLGPKLRAASPSAR